MLARLTMEAYAPKLPRQSISSSKGWTLALKKILPFWLLPSKFIWKINLYLLMTIENSKNLGKATTPDARACLVLRPRAVLSSPGNLILWFFFHQNLYISCKGSKFLFFDFRFSENDGMIGSINKIVDRKNSPAIKVQNPNTATSSAQRPHQEAKKTLSQAKKKATATARPVAMNSYKGSNIKTF